MSEEQSQADFDTMRRWVGGFGRNVGANQPYILSDELRQVLFPHSPSTSAVPSEEAQPIIEMIVANYEEGKRKIH